MRSFLRFVQERLCFTRAERTAIVFLSGCLLAGSVLRLLRPFACGLPPELMVEAQWADSVLASAADRGESSKHEGPLPVKSSHRAPVHINTAGLEELMTLPGVGPALARRIIEHRESVGPFESCDDLESVRGIGRKLIARIAPHIVVSAADSAAPP